MADGDGDAGAHRGGERTRAALALPALAGTARAQGFPDQPIRMFVPFAAGGPAAELDGEALAEIVQRISASVIARGARRVLLVPPDHTRLHSRAGEITVALRDQLSAASVDVAVLPALGTHAPMSATDASALFGPSLPSAELLRHDWRDGVRVVGVLSPEEVDARLRREVPLLLAACGMMPRGGPTE